jgi:hypothetical protein
MNIAYVDNNIPYCRTVVVRECATDMSYIRFHTDYRSPKIGILKQNPKIAVHFYSLDHKIQLSMNGTASIYYMDKITADAWHKTQFISRQCYLTPNAPSNRCDEPLLYRDNAKDTLFDTEQGYYNFAVIKILIKKIDFLYLHIHNNRRIIFTKNEANQFDGVWCNP